MFQDSPVCHFYRAVLRDTQAAHANSNALWGAADCCARHLRELDPSSPEVAAYDARRAPQLATQALQDRLHAAWGDAIVTGTEDAFMLAISDNDFRAMFKDLKSQA